MSDLSLHDKNIMRQAAENLAAEKTILADVLHRVRRDNPLIDDGDDGDDIGDVCDLLDDCIGVLVELGK